ncbi:phosphate ABC transporter permease PstA [Saccharococcus thermophilus]|uniref:Phosphate transport system permease protein PstA n=1 Tax=Saccharococcus thermophilus TaxID=29396 RepID=A0A846MFH4_9BACL|nr:phosphate ABC transporter permease PstA [Saccharococcus thermophilus]NIK15427.1 phosphate transport system permease protein [Saccharococcus thermophilus]
MKSRVVDKVWTSVFYVVAAFVISLLLLFLIVIFAKGWGFWQPDFLFGKPSNTQAGGGVGPQLINSLYMLVITLLISVPLGLGAGIYLAEYAKQGRMLNFIRLCIETMASLPSIVVGLFGLLAFVTLTGWGYTLIGGALAITILNLPGLTRICENAILDVPANIKEASLGLGATRWQTLMKVIVPAALPQIITGIILAAGRIFGEAAALIYTAGLTTPILNFAADLSSQAHPLNVFRPAETLTVHIWKLNSEGIVPDAKIIAAKSAAVLVIIVLLFNIIARFASVALQRYFSGSRRTTKKKMSNVA